MQQKAITDNISSSALLNIYYTLQSAPNWTKFELYYIAAALCVGKQNGCSMCNRYLTDQFFQHEVFPKLWIAVQWKYVYNRKYSAICLSSVLQRAHHVNTYCDCVLPHLSVLNQLHGSMMFTGQLEYKD